MKILILGSEGILGSYLAEYLKSNSFEVIGVNRKNYFSQIKNINKNLSLKIDTIVNCVAMTNVDACEKDLESAFISNAYFIKNFSQEINLKSIHLINISTDQVYSGKGPHIEKNIKPLNVYGVTKLLGEEYANNFLTTNLRINYIAKSTREQKPSFTDWLFLSLKKGKNITLFDDIVFNPLHVNDICKALKTVILNPFYGTFNLGSRDYMSKAEFGMSFAKELGLSTRSVEIGSYLDNQLLAKRPRDMSMDVKLFEETFEINLPYLVDAIKKISKDYL